MTRIPKRSALGLAAALIATPALATCPSGADLATGITLSRSAPAYETYYERSDGRLTEVRRATRGDQTLEVTQRFQHHLAPWVTEQPGGSLEFRYDGEVSELNNLKASRQWTSSLTVLQNGEPLTTGQRTVSMIDEGQMAVGGCLYRIWEVGTTTRLLTGAVVGYRQYYSPTLGLVLRSIQLDARGEAVREVRYDTITAGRAE
ncbi:MAG: hypothetical protein AAFS07_09340 [Pseudomonadota bacterium]